MHEPLTPKAMSISWNNPLSPQRNEIVFSGRNQQYGAFVIRRDYASNLIWSALAAGALLSLLFLSLMGGRKAAPLKAVQQVKIKEEIVRIEPKAEEKTEKPAESAGPKEPSARVQALGVPVIRDNAKDTAALSDKAITGGNTVNTGGTGTTGGGGNGTDSTHGTGSTLNPFGKDEVAAAFPGGDAAFVAWLQEHITYPEGVETEGRVEVEFVVGTDGKVSQVRILRDIPEAPELADEVQYWLKRSPAWKPGRQNGRIVESYRTIPVYFVLQNNGY